MYKISSAPKTYSQWIYAFDVLQNKNISKEEFDFLCQGTYFNQESSIEYFEKQLVKTINIMIKRYINVFKKNLELHIDYNEYNIYQLFLKLSKNFNYCMFFMHLDFTSINFRSELRDAIIKEVTKFWNDMVKSMYYQSLEQNDLLLDDEIYMIKRIRLFKTCNMNAR